MSSEKFFMLATALPRLPCVNRLDAIRQGIEGRPVMTFSTFLAYSFSPLPSNYLFIAYGLTSFPIAFLALPFFCRTPGELCLLD